MSISTHKLYIYIQGVPKKPLHLEFASYFWEKWTIWAILVSIDKLLVSAFQKHLWICCTTHGWARSCIWKQGVDVWNGTDFGTFGILKKKVQRAVTSLKIYQFSNFKRVFSREWPKFSNGVKPGSLTLITSEIFDLKVKFWR